MCHVPLIHQCSAAMTSQVIHFHMTAHTQAAWPVAGPQHAQRLAQRAHLRSSRCQRGRHVSRLQAVQEAPVQFSSERFLSSRTYTPDAHAGPVEVVEIAGKRFGLVATSNVSLGQLLLVSQPLAALLGERGAPPNNEELVELLERQMYEPWQAAWLQALCRHSSNSSSSSSDGENGEAASSTGNVTAGSESAEDAPSSSSSSSSTSTSSSSSQPASVTLAELQELLHGRHSTSAHASTSSSSNRGSEDASNTGPYDQQLLPCPVTRQQLETLVAQAAYAEESEDTAACSLREDLEPESVCGLWPAFALLNHSCAPNTAQVVVGTTLVVRAVRPVLAGEELTACYLGHRRFAPVAERRVALAGSYGFHCQCERCIAEQATFPTRYYPADDVALGLDSEAARRRRQKLASAAADAAASEGGQVDAQEAEADDEHGEPGALRRVFGWLMDRVWRASSSGTGAAAVGQLGVSPEHVLIQQLHTAASPGGELALAVQEALTTASPRPADRRQAVGRRLAAEREQLEGALARLRPPEGAREDDYEPTVLERRRQWLQASTYELLHLECEFVELTGVISYSPGDGATAPLRRCLDAADAVARGSDLHLMLAVKYLDKVRALYGPGSAEVRSAELLAARAHAARYGPLPAPLLRGALAARQRAVLAAALAARMSVMAWDGEAKKDPFVSKTFDAEEQERLPPPMAPARGRVSAR